MVLIGFDRVAQIEAILDALAIVDAPDAESLAAVAETTPADALAIVEALAHAGLIVGGRLEPGFAAEYRERGLLACLAPEVWASVAESADRVAFMQRRPDRLQSVPATIGEVEFADAALALTIRASVLELDAPADTVRRLERPGSIL